MSKRKNKISVPITRQGKDISRVIFQIAEDGKYDIKFEFMGNPYQVHSYRLFSLSPITWNVENPQNVNMSYHHGANDRKVLIHMKDITKTGKDMYRTLPISRIQPPNINQLLPIPLFKMEIPQTVVDAAPEYKAKSYHQRFELDKANVIEVFMASDEFDIRNYFENAYSHLMISQLMLSFEYFATGSVLSDYSKNEFFMFSGEPMERFHNMGGIQGMQLFVVKYYVPPFDELLSNLHITFIENELAEEMLLCTKVAYPQPRPFAKEYDFIYLGGPTLEQLKPPAGPLAVFPVMCNTTVLNVLNSEELSEEEKHQLELRSGNARARLYYEMKAFEDALENQKKVYKEKALLFLEAFNILRLKYQQSDVCTNAVENFFVSDISCISEYLYILFARYCGMEQVIELYRLTIKRGNKFVIYPWLILDDMLSVDLFPRIIDNLLGNTTNKNQEVNIFRSKPRFKNDELDGIRQKLEQRGYECSTPHYVCYNQKELKALYEQEGMLLENVYCMLGYVMSIMKIEE